MSSFVVTASIAAVVFGGVIVGLAVGVIFANKPLQGSCGGLANMRDENGKPMCMACEEMSQDCREEFERREAEAAG